MIPKIIHYCWFGNNAKPKNVIECIDSWKKYCPDYQIIEWNESNYDVSKNKYTSDAFSKKKWAFVSDFARLEILYEHGGIFLDTDVEIIKSLDDLLSNKAYMGFENSLYVAPGLGIGSEKNNEVLLKMIKEIYNDHSFIKKDNTFEATTSPVLYTNFLSKYGLKQNNQFQTVLDFAIYPSDYFCPKDFNSFEMNVTNNTYTIHHYDMSWVSDEGKYKHSLQIKLNRVLPFSMSKNIAKFVSIVKYKGISGLFKAIKIKLKNEEDI